MIHSLTELCDLIELSLDDLCCDLQAEFPLKVPKHFAHQIEKGNPEDPLLRQILPGLVEKTIVEGFSIDPVGDLKANPTPSLIHKYHGRALLIASGRCDIHCRYCFRRHFPYQQAQKRHWQTALKQIATDPSIEEIILSGGDPLSLSENSLIELVTALETIPHLTTLRLHSRTPIVAPSRAHLPNFWQHLQHSRLQSVLVVHCNHAHELTPDTAALFKQIQSAGVTLLNQTVLLKGVNDEVKTLTHLSKKLFQQGVLPYYCHLLDKVAGAAHFEVQNDQAWALFDQLRQQLPGYLVPRWVQEIAGEPYKTLLHPPQPEAAL